MRHRNSLLRLRTCRTEKAKMGHSPFAKKPSFTLSSAANRRSTRIERVCPVVISGRDASGNAYSQETETSIVNLHGCRVSTTHDVLVGMLVTIESLQTRLSAKAVCVHVWEPEPGETAHDVAVQFLKPQDLWKLEDTPEDWKATGTLAAPKPARTKVEVKLPPAAIEVPPPAPTPAKEAEMAAPNADLEARFSDFELRAWQMIDTILEKFQQQTAEVVRDTVEEFRQQVDVLAKDARERVARQADQAYADLETSFHTLRGDAAEQLLSRTEQVIDSAEEALRSRAAEILQEAAKSSSIRPQQ